MRLHTTYLSADLRTRFHTVHFKKAGNRFKCHNRTMAQRNDWTIESGTPEEIEQRRIEKWRTMPANLRLEALAQLRREVLGTDEQQLERTYRIVKVPRR